MRTRIAFLGAAMAVACLHAVAASPSPGGFIIVGGPEPYDDNHELVASLEAAPEITSESLGKPTLVEPADGAGQAAGATPCTSGCGAILLAWSYTPTLTKCSSTLSASCFLGFQATITPPTGSGGAVTVVPPCTQSVLTNCIGSSATTYTWRPGGPLFYGNWAISLVAVAVGTSASNTVSSLPDLATMAYPLQSLDAPTGATATPQQ